MVRVPLPLLETSRNQRVQALILTCHSHGCPLKQGDAARSEHAFPVRVTGTSGVTGSDDTMVISVFSGMGSDGSIGQGYCDVSARCYGLWRAEISEDGHCIRDEQPW